MRKGASERGRNGDLSGRGEANCAAERTESLEPLPAGVFRAWLQGLRAALRAERDADVPCGSCVACCVSSQFVHLTPDEVGARARIPRALLFPAPGRPRGHELLGYDRAGRCPMFSGTGCSIYLDRPRTCRTYDCRLFAATDLSDLLPPAIAERVRRWVFSVPTEDDREALQALRRAASYLRGHASQLPPGLVPTAPAPLALAALQVHELFLEPLAFDGGELQSLVIEKLENETHGTVVEIHHPR